MSERTKKVLICTVGTSLFKGNIEKINEQQIKENPLLKEIKEIFENKNWKLLAKKFQEIDPKDRI